MAGKVGDLSASQARYRDRVVTGTGLDPLVVTAWIGVESGWNVTKDGHNYLNIGKTRKYRDVPTAAQAVVDLIRTDDRYKTIRAAVTQPPHVQVLAITMSPWDENNYGGSNGILREVFNQLSGGDPRTPQERADESAGKGWRERLHDALGLESLASDALVVTLTVAFALAGLALVVLSAQQLAGYRTKG